MEEIKLEGMFQSPSYGRVGCKVRVIDGVAVAVFSNNKLGKDLAEAEQRKGNKNITWDERSGWLIEKFGAMKKEEIAIKLQRELNLKVK